MHLQHGGRQGGEDPDVEKEHIQGKGLRQALAGQVLTSRRPRRQRHRIQVLVRFPPPGRPSLPTLRCLPCLNFPPVIASLRISLSEAKNLKQRKILVAPCHPERSKESKAKEESPPCRQQPAGEEGPRPEPPAAGRVVAAAPSAERRWCRNINFTE